METTHVQEVVGSNPDAIYWMDIFSHGFIVKVVLFVRKRTKINEKEAGDWPFLTNFYGRLNPGNGVAIVTRGQSYEGSTIVNYDPRAV